MQVLRRFIQYISQLASISNHTTSIRPMTSEEIAKFDVAFAKMDEAFKLMGEAFSDIGKD